MTIRNSHIKVRSVGSRGALASFRIRTEIDRQTGVNNFSDFPAKLVRGSRGEVKISFPVKSPGQICPWPVTPRGETTDPGLAGKEFSRDPERKRFSR